MMPIDANDRDEDDMIQMMMMMITSLITLTRFSTTRRATLQQMPLWLRVSPPTLTTTRSIGFMRCSLFNTMLMNDDYDEG